MLTEERRAICAVPQEHSTNELGYSKTRYSFPIRKKLIDVTDKTIVDFGSGYGWGANYLMDCGAKKVIGIEINNEALEFANTHHARKGVENIKQQMWEHIDIPDESVDFCFSIESIEHIDTDERDMFLAEVKRILKNQGYLYITTPENRGSGGAHFKEYDLIELIKILESFGFRNIFVENNRWAKAGEIADSMALLFQK